MMKQVEYRKYQMFCMEMADGENDCRLCPLHELCQNRPGRDAKDFEKWQDEMDALIAKYDDVDFDDMVREALNKMDLHDLLDFYKTVYNKMDPTAKIMQDVLTDRLAEDFFAPAPEELEANFQNRGYAVA